MKEYIKYLKDNPNKMLTIQLILAFFIVLNLIVNLIDFNPLLSLSVALFSALVTSLISLQVWGEYKEIEGLWPAVKAFFK